MKVKETETSVKIKLTHEEAKYLKDILNNSGLVDKDSHTFQDREGFSYSLWNSLGDLGVY
jgi:hypothetical protein